MAGPRAPNRSRRLALSLSVLCTAACGKTAHRTIEDEIPSAGGGSAGAAQIAEAGAAGAEGEAVDSGIVYLSHYGTGQVTFTPITDEGRGDPIAISPGRGQDWGRGEGQIRVLGASPDLELLFVCLVGQVEDTLFAVRIDGSDAASPTPLLTGCPSPIGTPPYDVSPDSQRLAVALRDRLLVVSTNGADFDAPLLVATAEPDTYIDRVTWTDERVFYGQYGPENNQRVFFSALSDGSEVSSPRRVSPEGRMGNDYVRAVLSDGRVIMDFEGTLAIVPAEGGTATSIASGGTRNAALFGYSEQRGLAVISLWSNTETRTYAVVSLDGSDAGAEDPIVPEFERTDSALVLPDSELLVVEGDGFVYEASWSGGEPRLLTEDFGGRLLSVSRDERYLIACDSSQVVELDRTAEQPQFVPAEVEFDDLVGVDPAFRTLRESFDTCGEHILPVSYGSATPSGRELTLADGIVRERDRTGFDAVYFLGEGSEPERLSQLYPGSIGRAYLPEGSHHVYYVAGSAFYSSYVTSGALGQPELLFDELPSGQPSVSYVASLAGSLLVNGTSTELGLSGLMSVVSDGSGSPRVFEIGELSSAQLSPGGLVTTADSVIVADGGPLRRVPVDGSPPTVLLQEAVRDPQWGGTRSALYDEARDQVIAASGGRLFAVAADGSEADDPRILVDVLPSDAFSTFYSLSGIAGNYVLYLTAVDFTDVPQPDQGFVVALDGSDRQDSRLAPPGIVLGESPATETIGPFASPDGERVLAQSDDQLQLVSLAAGSEEPSLVYDGQLGRPQALELSPDETWVLVHAPEGGLIRVSLEATPGESAAPLPLTPPFEQRPEQLHFLDADTLLVAAQINDTEQLFLVDSSGKDINSWRLVANSDEGPTLLSGLSPDRASLFTTHPPERQLLSWPIDALEDAKGKPVTGDTDTYERVVGFVE